MSERCQSCGSELLPGQRYCRSCGTAAAIGRGSQEDAPTQILPPDGQAIDPNVTSQPSGPNTDQVFSSAPTANQPFYTQSQTVPLRADAAARPPGAPWGRITAFVVLGLIGVIGLCAVALFGPLTRQQQAPVVTVIRHKPPAQPPLPAMNPGVSVFNQGDAVDTGEESIFSTVVPLDEGASISLKNGAGNITVEGWDGPDAEVKVIKRGGSVEDRKTANVVLTNNASQMSLASAAPPGGSVQVDYQIKVPRQLSQLEIAAVSSTVTLSGIAGEIGVSIQRGAINLSDVRGTVNTNLAKGNTKVVFDEAQPEGPQKFNSVNGSVEVRLSDDVNADLKAETLVGAIKLDEAFGLKAEKRVASSQVIGRIGAGGAPILINTVNGDIVISK